MYQRVFTGRRCFDRIRTANKTHSEPHIPSDVHTCTLVVRTFFKKPFHFYAIYAFCYIEPSVTSRIRIPPIVRRFQNRACACLSTFTGAHYTRVEIVPIACIFIPVGGFYIFLSRARGVIKNITLRRIFPASPVDPAPRGHRMKEKVIPPVRRLSFVTQRLHRTRPLAIAGTMHCVVIIIRRVYLYTHLSVVFFFVDGGPRPHERVSYIVLPPGSCRVVSAFCFVFGCPSDRSVIPSTAIQPTLVDSKLSVTRSKIPRQSH